MKAWLHQCSGEIPKGMGSPCEMAKYELDNTFPETEWTICVVPEMKDGYRIDQDDGDGCFPEVKPVYCTAHMR